MTTDPPGLSIYVFGAAEGESIAVRLPDGGWGVVDSCSRSRNGTAFNPVLDFLRERDVKELEFLCLTHPHADHFKGMGMLMDALEIKRLWLPSVQPPVRLLAYLQMDAGESGDEDVSARAAELLNIYRKARELKASRKRRMSDAPSFLSYPCSGLPLYPITRDPAAPVSISALAPSGDQVAEYDAGLAKCFDKHGVVRTKFPDGGHNLISSALRIVFGETRIILGGDVEKKGWGRVLNDFPHDFLTAHAVKVSHHGSRTGYCPGLWRVFSKVRKPVAVVTCFASKELPEREGLEEILPHVDRLFTTCIDAVSAERLPIGIDRDHWESERALRAEIPGFRRADSYKHGVCGLHFDDRGNYEVELIPPAGEFPVRRRERT